MSKRNSKLPQPPLPNDPANGRSFEELLAHCRSNQSLGDDHGALNRDILERERDAKIAACAARGPGRASKKGPRQAHRLHLNNNPVSSPATFGE